LIHQDANYGIPVASTWRVPRMVAVGKTRFSRPVRAIRDHARRTSCPAVCVVLSGHRRHGLTASPSAVTIDAFDVAV
jgi:hypothetical protein